MYHGKGGLSGDWKWSELDSVRILFFPILSMGIGKYENWKVLESESVSLDILPFDCHVVNLYRVVPHVDCIYEHLSFDAYFYVLAFLSVFIKGFIILMTEKHDAEWIMGKLNIGPATGESRRGKEIWANSC